MSRPLLYIMWVLIAAMALYALFVHPIPASASKRVPGRPTKPLPKVEEEVGACDTWACVLGFGRQSAQRPPERVLRQAEGMILYRMRSYLAPKGYYGSPLDVSAGCERTSAPRRLYCEGWARWLPTSAYLGHWCYRPFIGAPPRWKVIITSSEPCA